MTEKFKLPWKNYVFHLRESLLWVLPLWVLRGMLWSGWQHVLRCYR